MIKDVSTKFDISNNSASVNDDLLEVEIGDTKQTDFLPQVKIKKWGNEVNFSVRHIDSTKGQVKLEDGKIKYISAKQEVHFYEKDMPLLEELKKNKISIDYSLPIAYKTDPFPQLLCGKQIISRDTEEERIIRQKAAEHMQGSILIVGLGLFVIGDYLQGKNVTVLEINKDVIDLVSKQFPQRLQGVTIINDDFYHFAGNTQQKFDWVYGDIFPVLNTGNIFEWEKFQQACQPLLNPNGIVDGRVKIQYEDLINNPPKDTGMEFEILLKQKPKSNVFNFSIQTKGLDFFYQPALTQRDIDDGCFRPESAIGSYAVYHATKTGNEYQAGKVAHIYRPKIIDANGNWVWGDLNINIQTGILTITVPQNFLDTGAYPIIVDPTFGYTSMGVSSISASNTILGSKFTAPAEALVTNMFVATSGSSGTVNSKCNVYLVSTLAPVNNGTNERTTFIASTFQEYGMPVNAPISNNVDYVLLCWSASGKFATTPQYDTGAAGQGYSQSLTYGAWPNPLVPTNDTKKFSMYAVYSFSKPANQNHLRPRVFAPGLAR